MVRDELWGDPEEERRIVAAGERRRIQWGRALRTADERVAMRAADLTRMAPNASPGLVLASAQADLPDEDFAQLAEMDDGGEDWFSRAIGLASDGVSWALGDLLYERAVKPSVRGLFLLGDTLSQELIQRPLTAASATLYGESDSFGDAYRDYGNSQGVVAAKRLLDEGPGVLARKDDPGTEADESFLGTGLIPGGEVGRESFDQRTLQIAGQRATLGAALPQTRLVGAIQPPGSFAYNTVAGVSQFAADVLLDPLTLLTGGSSALGKAAAKGARAVGASDQAALRVSEVVGTGLQGARNRSKSLSRKAGEAAETLREAERLAEAAGGVKNSRRQTVLYEKAVELIGNQRVLERLAEADALTIYQSFKKSAANTVDGDLLLSLHRASSPEEVSEVLLNAIAGGKVTEKGFYSGIGTKVRRAVNDTPLAGTSPRGRFSADDIFDAADKTEQILKAGGVKRETRAKLFVEALEARNNEDMFRVAVRAMEEVADATGTADDASKGWLTQLAKHVEGDTSFGRTYAVDPKTGAHQYGEFDPRLPTIGPDGKVVDVPRVSPQLTSELNNALLEYPDVTAIRRARQRITNAEKLYQSAGWEKTTNFGRAVTRNLFKPLAILRPAYVLRIPMGEEQLRLAAMDMRNLWRNPKAFFEYNIAAAKLDLDITGTAMYTQAENANVIARDVFGEMSKARNGARNATIAKNYIPRRKPPAGEPAGQFISDWRDELRRLAAAPEVKQLIQNEFDVDRTIEWFRTTFKGRDTLSRYAKMNSLSQDILRSDDALRSWLQGTVMRRIVDLTGGEMDEAGTLLRQGNPELQKLIADPTDRLFDDDTFRDVRDILEANLESAPLFIKAVDTAALEQGERNFRAWVDNLYEIITVKPTNTLARYPAFKGFYVQNLAESMSALADDALRSEVVAAAKKNLKLDKAQQRLLDDALVRSKGQSGFIDDLDEYNDVIMDRTGDLVKERLFDVSRRSNAQETLDLMFPFLDAWKEVTTTWARLLNENPAFFLKAANGHQSLRDRGVFYANDFGDEVFAYPGGGLLASMFQGEWNPDEQVTLEAPVNAVNLVAQGVGPGFGPMVQMAVGGIPQFRDPDFAELRDWLVPFGTGSIEDTGDLTNPSAWVETFVPAWMRKVVNATTSGGWDEVQWNSTVGDVMKGLANTGRYQPGDPNSQAKLVEDARRGARWLLLVRGVAQGVGPAGPSASVKIRTDVNPDAVPVEWDMQADPDGVFHSVAVLASDYRSLLEKFDYDEEITNAVFIQTYGVEPWYVSQAKSKGIVESPVTREGNWWVREHRDAAAAYPDVVGYFVPPEEGAELDYSIYRAQFDSGDRQSLTAEQQVQLANQSKARAMFNAAKRQLEGFPPAQRERALSQITAAIEEEFPGWKADVVGVGSKLRLQDRIAQMSRAAFDPRLSDSPVSQPLQQYMMARAQAYAVAQSRGLKTLSSERLGDVKAQLRAVGTSLVAEHPAFAGVWTRLLLTELED